MLKALDMKKNLFGTVHYEIGKVYQSIGCVEQGLNQLEKSMASFK